MPKTAPADPGVINLSDLVFTAKIDFLTVHTPGHLPLPKFDGKRFWARREHCLKLTIQDPSPADVSRLIEHCGDLRLAELEVAVDLVPGRHMPDEEREALVDTLMVHLIAKGLAPKVKDRDLQFTFRGVFEGTQLQFRLRPFNRVLPSPEGQQLHGRRRDPVQAKAYGKKVDQGRDLQPKQYVARQEVRVSGWGLNALGLVHVSDLLGFRYRKKLMPFMRHVQGVARRKRKSELNHALLALLRAKREQGWAKEWERVGCGAFMRGGRFEDSDVRFVRNTEVNNRIGQALLRLEERMKFVPDFASPEKKSQE